ncbi:MAG: Sec-independent protein translocase protein TatB [Desulfobacterales bacterium]|jgi:TatA/E family protein of Tat protein translocase
MFGIGMPEMLVILALALIVIGPKKLPDLAKSLGRAMREFKKATSEFKESIQLEGELSEVKETFNNISDDVKDAVDLNLNAEKQKVDKAESEDQTNEEKDKADEPELDEFGSTESPDGNIVDPDNQSNQSPDGETKMRDASPDTDDKNKKTKGPVNDA